MNLVASLHAYMHCASVHVLYTGTQRDCHSLAMHMQKFYSHLHKVEGSKHSLCKGGRWRCML